MFKGTTLLSKKADSEMIFFHITDHDLIQCKERIVTYSTANVNAKSDYPHDFYTSTISSICVL